MVKALFLDRDGTINRDFGYVHEPERFVFNDGVVDFCLRAQELGYEIFVVTNQSGVARGYYTVDEMDRCNADMVARFSNAGVKIVDVQCCTAVDDADRDRKPNPGMFIKLRDRYDIDMSASVSLGDKPRDVEAGRRAGVGKNLLFTGDFNAPMGEL